MTGLSSLLPDRVTIVAFVSVELRQSTTRLQPFDFAQVFQQRSCQIRPQQQ